MVHVEYARHLKTLSFFCPSSDICQKDHKDMVKSLKCSSKGIELPLSQTSPSLPKSCRLRWPIHSRPLDLYPRIKQPSSDCICFEFSFAIEEDLQSAKDQEAQILLDSKALKSLSHIECATCSQMLLRISQQIQPFKFADTPSEYWHELLDCWACHKEDYSGLPGQKGGIILAQKNGVLVSTQYVIVHPENTLDGTFKCLEKVNILVRFFNGESKKAHISLHSDLYYRYLADTLLQEQKYEISFLVGMQGRRFYWG